MRSFINKTSLTAPALLTLALLGACGEKPQTMLESAKDYLAKNDHQAALIQAKNALQRDPNLPEARFLLGSAMLEIGDAAGAELELRKALELGHSRDEVVPQLAKALLARGAAQSLTTEFAATDLTQPEAKASLMMSLSGAYALQGKTGLSTDALNAALVAQPEYPPALLAQAQQKASQQDFGGAMAQVDAVLAKAPTNHEAWKLKGDIELHANRKTDEALTAYRKATHLKPNYLAGRYGTIGILLQQGNLVEAQTHIEQLRKLAPNHPRTHYLAAQLAYQRKDPKTASELALQVLTATPNDVQALQLAGVTALQLKALPQAQAHLSRALDISPDLRLPRRLLVETYLRSGQAAKALQTLLPGLNQKSIDPALLSLAGEVYLHNGDLKKAETYFTQAASQAPGDGNKRTSLALVHLISGATDSAFEELHAISESDSGTSADLVLISTHLKRREWDQALLAIDRLEKKQADQPAAPYLRAQTLLAKRDVAGARKNFERALGLAPGFFPAAAGLATLDLADKKPEVAKKRFDSVLAQDPQNLQALLAQAELAEKTGANKTEVARLIGNVVTAHPQDARTRVLLVNYHLQKKDVKEASAAAQSAMAALPDNPQILDALGRTQYLAGEFNQAMASFTKLVDLVPQSAGAYIRLAETQLAIKDKEAAANTYRAGLRQVNASVLALKLHSVLLASGKGLEANQWAATWQKDNPKDATFPLYLGGVALAGGDYSAAEKNYLAVIALQENNAVAYNNLAWVSAKLKKENAMTYAEKALALAPKQPAFIDTLAMLHSDKGNYAKALELQTTALGLQPGNAYLKLNLAKIHLKGGKGELARKELDELSKLGDKFPAQSEVSVLLKSL